MICGVSPGRENGQRRFVSCIKLFQKKFKFDNKPDILYSLSVYNTFSGFEGVSREVTPF